MKKLHKPPPRILTQTAWALTFFVLFLFLVALRLDNDIDGSWFYIFVPLFVVEAILLLLLLVFIMNLRFKIRNVNLDNYMQFGHEKLGYGQIHQSDEIHDENDVMVDMDDDQLVGEAHIGSSTEVKIYASSDYSLHEAVHYSLLLAMAIWQEIFLALQFDGTTHMNWFVVLLPSILYFFFCSMYYFRMAMLSRMKHGSVIPAEISFQRSLVCMLFFLLVLLVAARVQYDEVSIWVVWIPLFILMLLPLWWVWRFYTRLRSSKAYEPHPSDADVYKIMHDFLQNVTVYKLLVCFVISGALVAGFIVLGLRVEQVDDWSWMVTFSPFFIVLLLLTIVLCLFICMPSWRKGHDSVVYETTVHLQNEEGELDEVVDVHAFESNVSDEFDSL